MFGELLGALVSAPIRLLNVPMKIAQKTAEAADKFMSGPHSMNYQAPRRNTLDRVADAIDESCKAALGDE
jgi:hypothetical protein